MIPIILSDGYKIEVENESSKNDIVVRVKSFAELDEWKRTLTEENINGAVMEEETLTDLIFTDVSVSLEEDNIRADFRFREKSETEITQERINELEDAVNFLLMKGEE